MPLKVLIAPDKFKGSLTAPQAADAIAKGILRALPDAQLDLCPMADGGEGTVHALVAATGGKLLTHRVTGPLPHMQIDATFGLLGDPSTAVIEMASASGLALLKPEDRDPCATTSFGTGQLLLAAANLGVKHIILGIGGSATIDAGLGCAQAAGLTVLMRDGEPVSPTEPLTARDLDNVILVKRGRGSPIDHVQITVACDVTNPLYGPSGAAPVFGPQKGATPEQVRALDDSLKRLAERLGKTDLAQHPGAGAAGGLGFAMLAFFNATLRPGIDLVIDATGFRKRLAQADLCITGEGRLDQSTLSGKTPSGIARLCKEQNIPCIALAGSIDLPPADSQSAGFTAAHAIRTASTSLEQAMKHGPLLLETTAYNALHNFTPRN